MLPPKPTHQHLRQLYSRQPKTANNRDAPPRAERLQALMRPDHETHTLSRGGRGRARQCMQPCPGTTAGPERLCAMAFHAAQLSQRQNGRDGEQISGRPGGELGAEGGLQLRRRHTRDAPVRMETHRLRRTVASTRVTGRQCGFAGFGCWGLRGLQVQGVAGG